MSVRSKWLRDRVCHESFSNKQKQVVTDLAEQFITETPTKEAIVDGVYDTAYLTINAIHDGGLIPVQHTRVRRRLGEPKYKSEPDTWDAPVHLIPDISKTNTLYLTEGFSKAVAIYLTGSEVIALPGVGMCQGWILDTVLSSKAESIVIIFDSSAEENPKVTFAATELSALLNSKGKNAAVLSWSYQDYKGLDDLVLGQGLGALKEVLNRSTKTNKKVSESISSGDSIFDVTSMFIRDLEVQPTDLGFRVNNKDSALTFDQLCWEAIEFSKEFKEPDKKGVLRPVIRAKELAYFESYLQRATKTISVYSSANDRVYFADEEVEYYKSKVAYTEEYDPTVLETVTSYLPQAIEGVDVFRALCRKVLSTPGKIEKNSLALFLLLGAPGTGKSMLGKLISGLTGEAAGIISVGSLKDIKALGSLEWKRLMRDDDLGGHTLNKDIVRSLLTIASGSILVRPLYQANKEISWDGTLLMTSVKKIAAETEAGLARRLKTIQTKHHAHPEILTSIPTNKILSALAHWALTMTDRDYAAVLNTDTQGEIKSLSDVGIFIDKAVSYSKVITPVRELHHYYDLQRKYSTKLSSFVEEATVFLQGIGAYAETSMGEPALFGEMISRNNPTKAGDIIMAGKYTEEIAKISVK
jgi:Domain of unknown function (DUF3854)